ncbi:MAG: FtsQ-type POTRA domain-containing protein [Mogibacterium sp.]|nr:FtsQ-type POTRA domain-containing protein [Mogibacterium sp.]
MSEDKTERTEELLTDQTIHEAETLGSTDAKGSADVDVAGIIDAYAGLSDTMVKGKTIQLQSVPSETIQMDAPRPETVQMGPAGTATIQMDAPRPETVQMGPAQRETVQVQAVSAETVQTEAADTADDQAESEAGTETPAQEADKTDGGSAEEGGKDQQKEESGKPETDPETEAIKEKIRERKREKIRRARRRRVRFWTILITILAAACAFAFSISGFFTVDSIEVRGNQHFTAEEIINIGHAVPGHNIIYDPGKQEIIEYLEQNPYIKTANVTRKLPSTLVITVNERVQACAFRYDDDYLVMDDEGILLKKTRTEPKITMIKGLVVTKIKLGEKIGTQNQKLFSSVLSIIRSMNAADMYFVTIDMTSYEDDYQVRAYIYDNLVVRSDLNSLITNLDNGRLHKITDKLFEDGVSRGTIILGDDGSASFEPGI